jgi:alanine racemase
MRDAIERRLEAAGLPPLPRTAWLEIDLDALAANLATLRRRAGDGVPVRPVVKADAYGHGAVPIARALEAGGADGFCVATFDEAIALREAGIRRPIAVLYPVPPATVGEAARREIAVSAGDVGGLDATLSAAAAVDPDHPLAIELEVDTGLGRGGFVPAAVTGIARRIAETPGALIAGLWTHFQAVDDIETTATQVARFEAVIADLREAAIPLPVRHVAASAALLTDDGLLSYDGVRPGLAIYGIVPDELDAAARREGRSDDLRPVMALYARPVRVVDMPSGTGISYGPTFRTTRPSRIATLPIGYGDGWSRRLSNRADAIVRGVRVPLVGNVAMDAVMADVTDVPGAPITTADEFTLIGSDGGQEITIGDVAQVRTTISWEVMTNMSYRLPRVYHAATGPVGLRTLTERKG